jgi:hypothetical protein
MMKSPQDGRHIEVRPAGSKPRPSSAITIRILSLTAEIVTVTVVGCACRIAFVRASCKRGIGALSVGDSDN